MENTLKVKDITKKLKEVNCPLIVGNDDSIAELLFKPGLNRMNLLSWIFSSLGFTVLPVDTNQTLLDEKTSAIFSTAFSLGLCSKERADIIQGTAKLQDQLPFWHLLIEILWKKLAIRKDASHESSSENFDPLSFSYDVKCNYKNNILESVNFRHLYENKLKLFPPYLVKECREIQESDAVNIESLKSSASEKAYHDVLDEKVNSTTNGLHLSENCDQNLTFSDVDKLANEIQTCLSEFCGESRQSFEAAYTDLKPYLSTTESSNHLDVGPSFANAESTMESFLRFRDAVASFKSSDAILRATFVSLSSAEFQNGSFPDTELKKYIDLLSNSTSQEKESSF